MWQFDAILASRVAGRYHSTINVLETVAISGQIMAEEMRGVNVNTFENQLDLAKAGNPKAQFNIGNVYLEGSGGAKQSIKKAVKWFKKSAAAGLPQAQANLVRSVAFATTMPSVRYAALYQVLIADHVYVLLGTTTSRAG